jgi:hypothetical protein
MGWLGWSGRVVALRARALPALRPGGSPQCYDLTGGDLLDAEVAVLGERLGAEFAGAQGFYTGAMSVHDAESPIG